MTTEADLLEAAATLVRVFTVESSWNTVEMTVQASYDITKVVPKVNTRSSDLCPELTEVNLHFTFIQKYLYRVSWALVWVEFQACDF